VHFLRPQEPQLFELIAPVVEHLTLGLVVAGLGSGRVLAVAASTYTRQPHSTATCHPRVAGLAFLTRGDGSHPEESVNLAPAGNPDG